MNEYEGFAKLDIDNMAMTIKSFKGFWFQFIFQKEFIYILLLSEKFEDLKLIKTTDLS